MSAVLIDSNIILDLVTRDEVWSQWSAGMLRALASEAILVINPIVYAEVSAAFTKIEDVEDTLPAELFRREPLPYEAAFLAGRCHRAYRRRGGARPSILPDFYIGAHAAIRGHRLLTRDARRFSGYFPTIEIICPQ